MPIKSCRVACSGKAKKFAAPILHYRSFKRRMGEFDERCCPVQLTTTFRLFLCALICPLSLLGRAGEARAWVDEPLCAAQSPTMSSYYPLESDAALLCEYEESYVWQGPLWTAPITAAEARRAMNEAVQLAETSPTDALLKLRLVERAMPRIQDRLAVKRAEVLMRLGRISEACDAYRLATDSLEPNLAVEAQIGLVRCMLDDGQKKAEVELERLTSRFPRLGERSALQLSLARAREKWNNQFGAIALYRNIALFAPESRAAIDARAALDRLAAAGAKVQPFTPLEIVERAERLVERGPIEMGRNAVNDLLAMTSLPAPLRGRAHILAVRVARMEGDWARVREEVTLAINSGIRAADAQRFLPRVAVEAREPGEGEAKVRRLLAGRSLGKCKQGQLRAALDIALEYNLREVASEALEVMTTRVKLPPPELYQVAILASGVASDESLAAAFATLHDVRPYQAAATYYHARALERLGRIDEARARFHAVTELEDPRAPYYSSWAQARLSGFEQLAAGSCLRDSLGGCAPDTGVRPASEVNNGFLHAPALNGVIPAVSTVFGAAAHAEEGVQHGQAETGLPSAQDQRRENIVSRLRALASTYGEAYPWLARAADFAEIELYDAAAAEVGETYLSFRDARGSPRLRAGIEAVLTSNVPARRSAPGRILRDRLALDETGRWELAEVADLLGEPGIALKLRAQRSEVLPRAYQPEVERAAARFGVDPNLIYAVMRQESVYYRNIVSHAGAVGLMQIMPYTGMRIARALGIIDFNPRELLTPRTNVEFSAWYLGSLIKRFDGRVPLAVAAYNGGPHNVRLWINRHPANMPLDAFLERIPFRETNGYVRRVLTNYAAYRAQQNLAMPNLAVTMPRLRPDSIAF